MRETLGNLLASSGLPAVAFGSAAAHLAFPKPGFPDLGRRTPGYQRPRFSKADCRRFAAGRKENAENNAIPIGGGPEIMLRALNPDEHRVGMRQAKRFFGRLR